VHQTWSGDLVSVQYYYPSWSQRDMIRYWYPTVDPGVIGSDTIAILANGRNPVLAHDFLNYMIDWDNGLTNFRWNGYVPPFSGITDPGMLVKGDPMAIPNYAIVPPGMANLLPQESDFEKGIEGLELKPEVDNLWKDAWEVVQTT